MLGGPVRLGLHVKSFTVKRRYTEGRDSEGIVGNSGGARLGEGKSEGQN